MGATEEIGKAASATVSALATTPVVLSLVVFNVLFMLMVGYLHLKASAHWDHEIERWSELAKSCLTSKASP
jgi:hypothetical protein